MIKVNTNALLTKVNTLVNQYYSLETKPEIQEIPKEKKWIHDMISQYVDYTIINLELEGIKKIVINEKVDFDDYKMIKVNESCLEKKNYKIVRTLGEYSDKILLKNNKVAKIKMLYMWNYKQKNEMKAMINNEFKICEKAYKLNIGPKVHDTFICYNETEKKAYKVVITEFIKGISLDKWLENKPSETERKNVSDMLKKKITKMHENGIIHNSLHSSNVILEMSKRKVINILITDFVRSYDVKDKSMWEYNEWIRSDRRIIDKVTNNFRSYSNSDDVTNYVAHSLIKNNDIMIT